jgi:hypothetical protein
MDIGKLFTEIPLEEVTEHDIANAVAVKVDGEWDFLFGVYTSVQLHVRDDGVRFLLVSDIGCGCCGGQDQAESIGIWNSKALRIMEED